MSIKEQATKSVFWSAIERFSVQGIQFILTIIIARILSPDDYGLIAMLGIFLALSQVLIDSGFAFALVQKQERTETDYNTAFYFNAFGSLFIYIILYLLAPYIANFFEEPQLTIVTRVLGINLIIMSLGIVQQAKLTIALDFKHQAMASLIAVIISGGIGLWMAYSGYGVWTLVFQSIANNFLRVCFLWVFSRWLPCWKFSYQSFSSLFRFGSKLMLTGLMHELYSNLYSLIIGKFFSASDLGYYNRSYTLAQFPSANIANVIVRAVYPIQCRYQDDMEQLRSMFMKYMRISCYVIFPFMVTLFVLAESFVLILLTEKWLPAVAFIKILSLAFVWDPIMKINNNILSVKGRTDYALKAEVIKKIVAIVLLVVSVPFGITIMCFSLVLYAVADMVIIIYFSRKVINIGYCVQFRGLLPVVFLNIVMGVVMYGITCFPLSVLAKLLIPLVVGWSLYLFLSWLFKMQEWSIFLSLIKRK